MARPLRIEFPGAFYHVTFRGHRKEPIYEDDTDRVVFLDILGEVMDRFNWRCYAYCQMTNHYHLVVQTMEPSLSSGMRYLNGVYTQASNRRHQREGHVFQGRYKAVVVDADEYLLALARHVVLNPVRAGFVEQPGQWAWSSYRATAAHEPAPGWLAKEQLLARLDTDEERARTLYRQYILDDPGEDVWRNVRQQLYLGDEDFVKRIQATVDIPDDPAIVSVHRRAPVPPLEEVTSAAGTRDEAIARAYRTGLYSYADLGKHFGLHPSSISRIVRKESRGSMQ